MKRRRLPANAAPVEWLAAHSRPLALAAGHLAYAPLVVILAMMLFGADAFAILLVLHTVLPVWWLISLLVLAAVALQHRGLYRHARETAGTWPVADPASLQLRLLKARQLARASLLFGPFLIIAICALAARRHPQEILGGIATGAFLTLLTWLPATLFWYSAAKRDAALLRRLPR